MSDNITIDPEKISMLDFKLLKNNVESPEYFDINQVTAFVSDEELQIAYNIPSCLIKANFFITINAQNQTTQAQNAVANFHLVYIFHVQNLEQLIQGDNKNILHPDLAQTITAITYSTSRGVLLGRLSGTALQNFILPIVNPNKIKYK
jgi:hypothetical protein